jgi:hypothetical protein
LLAAFRFQSLQSNDFIFIKELKDDKDPFPL